MLEKYRVHCETCGDVPTLAAAVPTECPNNPAHVIDPDFTVVLCSQPYVLKSSATLMTTVETPTAEDPNWEEVGAVIVDVSFIIPYLEKAIGRFVADFKTNGPGVKARIVEYKDGEADSVLKEATLPNTGDAWKHNASVDTDPAVVAMREGRNRYTLEIQLPGGGVVCSVRNGSLALIEDRT